MIAAYIIIGILWGAFAIYMQRRTYGTAWVWNTGVGVLNAALWPVAMVYAFKKMRRRGPIADSRAATCPDRPPGESA